MTKFILFCITLGLSDNLTETPNMKNSNGNNASLASNEAFLFGVTVACEHSRNLRKIKSTILRVITGMNETFIQNFLPLVKIKALVNKYCVQKSGYKLV